MVIAAAVIVIPRFLAMFARDHIETQFFEEMSENFPVRRRILSDDNCIFGCVCIGFVGHGFTSSSFFG
jgi:hypothetical protein